MSIKVSIITVCLNAELYIERAIQSVVAQAYPLIEYIIVDGKSTDKTMQVIEKYRDRIHVIISEKDNGIYDAMNKGVSAATGDVLYFLNADDYLKNPEVVEKIIEVFIEQPSADFVYGDLELINKETVTFYNPRTFHGPLTDTRDFFNNGMCQQRFFVRRKVFNDGGYFDTRYKILGDFDFLLRSYIKGRVFQYVDLPVATYRLDGLSYQLRGESVWERRLIGLRRLQIYQWGWFLDNFFRKW